MAEDENNGNETGKEIADSSQSEKVETEDSQFKTPIAKRRKSLGGKRKSTSGCFRAFKSPVLKKRLCDSEDQPATADSSDSTSCGDKRLKLAKEVVALEDRSKELDTEIKELETKFNEDDLNVYINALHDYNEIKDAAQMVLGRLAEWQRTTTMGLYSRFGLELDD